MPDARQGTKAIASYVLCITAILLGYYGGSLPRILLLFTVWPIAMIFSVTAPPLQWIYPALCALCAILRAPDWMTLPTILLLVMSYGGLILDQRLKDPVHRAFLWGGMALLSFTFYLASLSSYMQSNVFEGLTNLVASRVTESPQADSILMQLYNRGLLALGSLFPKDELLTEAALTIEIREELIRSLHSYLSYLSMRLLPLMLGDLPIVSAWACLFPASYLKRRRGLTAHTLPRAETWYIPSEYTLTLLVLWITGLVLMNNRGTLMTAGTAIYAFVLLLFTVQGACLWIYRFKRNGVPPFTRHVIITLVLLLVPFILQISGVFDQVKNLRDLRGSKESEGSKK